MPGTALITGASSGIGAAFARHLAPLGQDLILVARREDRLEQLAQECSQQHGVNAQALVADLSNLEDIARVEARIAAQQDLEWLINNAGFGSTGWFARIDPQKHHDMINVHVVASMRLTRAALPGMIDRGRGSIINVSSTGAFVPPLGNANYCATKAYLVTLSQTLSAELRGTGVGVQVLCPGFTHTEFHDQAEYKDTKVKSRIPTFLWMEADEVVSASLHDLKKGKVLCVPGFPNRVAVAMGRIGIAPLLSKLLVARFRKRPPKNGGSAKE